MENFSDLTSTQLLDAAQKYWLIPIGMIAIYFYGMFHFNTPDYDIVESSNGGNAIGAHLASLAPPRYTTTRRRFRRYARRYVFLLEAAFLFAIFAWPIFQVIAHQKDAPVPDLGDLQTRAIWALFTLTGLLSSFPYVKDIDTWILKRLHEAALIPKGARTFAQDLFNASLIPQPPVAEEVRKLLQRRDTIKVAEGKATGSLEQMILKTMWLRSGMKRVISTSSEAETNFKIRMQRELEDIDQTAEIFIRDARRYFQDQERAFPVGLDDIDEGVDSPPPDFKELPERRRELVAQARNLYFRMCVLVTLYVNIVTKSSVETSGVLRKIGFNVEIQKIPVWNVEALFVIGIFAFFTVLVLQIVGFAALDHFNFLPHPENLPHPQPGRGPSHRTAFIFSLVAAILYSLAIVIARGLKRRWSRGSEFRSERPDNLLIAIVSYVTCVSLTFILGAILIRGDFISHMWISLSQLGFFVAGYFAAIYVDREMEGSPFSWKLAWLQAGGHFLASLLGAWCLMPDPPFPITDTQRTFLAVFMAVQVAAVGLVVGCMTQQVYRGSERRKFDSTSTVGDVAVISIGEPVPATDLKIAHSASLG